MTLGDKVAKLRKDAGYTRNDFADKLNMSPNTLRNYELGIHEPGHEFIVTIAKTFNVSTDYLLGILDEPINEKKKAPAPEESETEAERLIDLFYTFLVHAGYVAEGDNLTSRQMDYAAAILNLITLSFGNEQSDINAG